MISNYCQVAAVVITLSMDPNDELRGGSPQNVRIAGTDWLSQKVPVVRSTTHAARHRYDFSTPPNRVSQTTSVILIVLWGSGCDSNPGDR